MRSHGHPITTSLSTDFAMTAQNQGGDNDVGFEDYGKDRSDRHAAKAKFRDRDRRRTRHDREENYEE
jgi:hypothetical protein